MTDPSPRPRGLDDPRVRWSIYRIFMVATCAFMVARILIVESDQGTPFLSANDRSRWCTIRALGDDQTYVIDQVILKTIEEPTGPNGEIETRVVFDNQWNTIDKVWHKGHDGEEHFYSSKPTLYPTMLAGEYMFLRWLTGWNLTDDTEKMARLMLIVTNVIPMLLFFVLVGLTVERCAKRNWTRIFVMACATFGTFLTSYSITLNNHLPAAVSVMACLYCLIVIWSDEDAPWGFHLAAGLTSAFAAANELPALSFFVASFCIVMIRAPRWGLCAFVPGALVVVGAFFLTNFMAHESWRPPYTHRGDGPRVAVIDLDMSRDLNNGVVPAEVRQALDRYGSKLEFQMTSSTVIRPALQPGRDGQRRWEIWDPENKNRLVIAELRNNASYEIRQWDNWYEYESSYWLPGRQSVIDSGEDKRGKYILHMSVGHHGYFSLTPIWVLAFAGLLVGCGTHDDKTRIFVAMTLVLFVVCFAFYAARPTEDRNYGGQTSGLRWLFWFAPLFLVGLIPICDRFARNTWFQLLAEVCLAVSIFSWAVSPLNPWVHPWLYQWFVTPPGG